MSNKPRYDEDENVSRHSATHPKKCAEMAKKYGWELNRIEKNKNDSILKVDCVFNGKTEFPKHYTTEEE
ncbi:MAG: hypothetical protein F6K48_26225 [Okeania sp. SIO3H1]|uniref:hypothetical protein n=1 Tax=Okeania sp. SIO1I7 TaxID=2607772 RepID=UPI0013C9AD70|nr:hypothetical protein [Okeania sp. SIO1I7]NEN92209.1 hypothetical protein [Okeania sp. SIO3H1]NET30294.1 hypothetical protein [Okeania sp. SIO1I7]